MFVTIMQMATAMEVASVMIRLFHLLFLIVSALAVLPGTAYGAGFTWSEADVLLNKHLPAHPELVQRDISKKQRSAQTEYVLGMAEFYTAIAKKSSQEPFSENVYAALKRFQASHRLEPNLRTILGWYRLAHRYHYLLGYDKTTLTNQTIKIGTKQVPVYDVSGPDREKLAKLYELAVGLKEPASCRQYLDAMHLGTGKQAFLAKAQTFKDFWIPDAVRYLSKK